MAGNHIDGARRHILTSVIVGIGYVLTLTVTDATGTVLFSDADAVVNIGRIPARSAGGFVLGGVLGVIAARVPGSRRRHFLVWWLLVFLSTVGVIIEGRFYAPNLVPLGTIPWDVASQVVVAAVVATFITFIYVPATASGSTIPDLPGARRLFVGVVAGTLTYSVLYFVVGALNYAFVTGPYYEQSVDGLVNPPLQVIFIVFLLRGALLSVSLIPLVRTVKSPRQRAWMSALSVATLTGFLPLLVQVGRLPLVVLVASSYEIALQVGPAAVIVAAVLGKDAAPSLRAELRRMWKGRSAA
jgi:hypothetical protein